MSSILYTSYAGSSYGCALIDTRQLDGPSIIFSFQNLLSQRGNRLHCSLSSQTYRLDPILFHLLQRTNLAYLRDISFVHTSHRQQPYVRSDVHADSQHLQA
jgi:hypothetical protein